MRLVILLFVSVLSINTFAGSFPLHPNITTSPGDLCTTDDYDFERFRYDEQIAYCSRDVSRSLKNEVYDNYGIPKSQRGSYIIDHIIPLSIGGSNAIENLWPQHHTIKNALNPLEYSLHVQMREGEITQAQAVEEILEAKFSYEGKH